MGHVSLINFTWVSGLKNCVEDSLKKITSVISYSVSSLHCFTDSSVDFASSHSVSGGFKMPITPVLTATGT